jgi:hypothetical protein
MKLSVEQIPYENEEELCRNSMLFRCSKSMILNADKIQYVRPSVSGRFEATLTNNEKVIISRQMYPFHLGVYGYIDRLLFKNGTVFGGLVDSHDIACSSLGSDVAAPCAPLGILVWAAGCGYLCQFYSGGENSLASDRFRSERSNGCTD